MRSKCIGMRSKIQKICQTLVITPSRHIHIQIVYMAGLLLFLNKYNNSFALYIIIIFSYNKIKFYNKNSSSLERYTGWKKVTVLKYVHKIKIKFAMHFICCFEKKRIALFQCQCTYRSLSFEKKKQQLNQLFVCNIKTLYK